MSTSVPPRKAPATHYQALHPDQVSVPAAAHSDIAARITRPAVPRPVHVPRRQSAAQAEYYAAETVKIETLKNALFEALETSPAAAIPPQLIDLAHTYSNLLKIQLAIMPDAAPVSVNDMRASAKTDTPAPEHAPHLAKQS